MRNNIDLPLNIITTMKGLKAFVKKYIALLMCVFALQAKAQIKHVIYIQTEDKKSFYVTANGQTKNSTESGYIILPQIADSLYSMTIGSSNNDFPQQKFVVNMNNNDWEFTFRKNNDEYELFDMIHSTALGVYKEPVAKSVEVVTASATQDSTQQKSIVKNDTAAIAPEQKTAASDTAAEVAAVTNSAQDSSKQKSIVIQDNTVTAQSKTDLKNNAIAEQSQPLNEDKQAVIASSAKKTQPAGKKTGYYKINKIFERTSTQGVDLIYVDERKPKFDTIAIFIPVTQNITKEESRPVKKEVTKPAPSQPAVVITPEPQQKAAVPEETATTTKQPATTVAVASDDDFLNLRKRMASADNENDMLAIAKDNFTGKKYTVNQIKNLGVLFLNEKNRYSFFETAKPATSDSKNFYKLINQLTQQELIEKFAALIQQ